MKYYLLRTESPVKGKGMKQGELYNTKILENVGVRSFWKSETSEFRSFPEMENIGKSGVSGNRITSKCYVRIRPDPDVPRGGTKRRVRRTAIDCPPQNACRRNEYKNRGDRRRPEPSRRIRAFRRTSDRDEGEVSNISSEVIEYKYTKYIY